jgi:hypothetical protein
MNEKEGIVGGKNGLYTSIKEEKMVLKEDSLYITSFGSTRK